MMQLRMAMPVVLFAALALHPYDGIAHALRLAAAPTATGFAGRVAYSDASPAIAEAVVLLDANGAVAARTRTDREGRFSLAAPAEGRYTLVAEGEEGHRAEQVVAFAGGATRDAATGCSDTQALGATLRNELQPLREDLARYEQRIRLHDVIGGIGFIVGLAGAWVFWAARRERRKAG